MQNKLFPLLIIVIIFVAACEAAQPPAQPAEPGESDKLKSDKFKSCKSDSDCISVQEGCCGCNYGGAATSINRIYEDEWNEQLAEDCREIACPAVISDHWTCFAEPKCADNVCVLE